MKTKTIFGIFAALVVLLAFTVMPVAAETFTVDAKNNGMTLVESSSLTAGTCYKIDAGGMYIFGSCLSGDAEWQNRSCNPLNTWQKWGGGSEPTPPIIDWGDLLINDISVDWGNYNPLHEYSVYRMGTGVPITFRIADSQNGGDISQRGAYGDNSGSLTVTITPVGTETKVVNLFAGKDSVCNTPVGTVTISNDAEYIYVKYEITNPDWYLTETHFDIQDNPANFPRTSTGNPKVGQFKFGDDNIFTQSAGYTIHKDEVSTSTCEFYIATHASIINPGDLIVAAEYPASGVVSNNLGKRADGSNVLVERTSTVNALTQDYSGGAVNFYSLGFGGDITVTFNCPIANGDGNDVAIYEVTNSEYPPESATVEASSDGVTYVTLGTGTNGRTAPRSSGSMITRSEFDLGTLSSAKYIRITDTSNKLPFEATADAFDLDGVYSLQDCMGKDVSESVWGATCPSPTKISPKGNWATYFEYDNCAFGLCQSA